MKTKQIKTAKGAIHWVLSEGSCAVKIYASKQVKHGVTYVSHCLTYSVGDKRIRKTFSELDEAKTWGARVLTSLTNGETAINGVTAAEMQTMVIANQELAGLNTNLIAAAREYRQATEQLKGKATINDAVRFFLAKANPDLPKKMVPELNAELYAAKTRDGLSAMYVNDLKTRLGRFAKAFPGEIGEITTAAIEKWLRGLGTGPKNRNNYATSITTLFNFGKREGYLSADRATAAEGLTRAKDTGGEIEIYSPEELTAMLIRVSEVKPELLPFVAIGAFAGVRAAEISRLAWEDIDFDQKLIEVGAKKSKTAQRRHVPIQPNLDRWLAPYRGKTGLIITSPQPQVAVRKVVEPDLEATTGKPEKGVKWKANALRHSFGSYRLPILKSANELALEMGNSPGMIFRHYRELVKPAEAVKFWAIEPPASTKAVRVA